MPHTHSTTHNKLNLRKSASKAASTETKTKQIILFHFISSRLYGLLVGEKRFLLLFQTASQVCKTETLLLDSLFWSLLLL